MSYNVKFLKWVSVSVYKVDHLYIFAWNNPLKEITGCILRCPSIFHLHTISLVSAPSRYYTLLLRKKCSFSFDSRMRRSFLHPPARLPQLGACVFAFHFRKHISLTNLLKSISLHWGRSTWALRGLGETKPPLTWRSASSAQGQGTPANDSRGPFQPPFVRACEIHSSRDPQPSLTFGPCNLFDLPLIVHHRACGWG